MYVIEKLETSGMEAESQMSNDKKKLKVYIFGYRPSVSNSFTNINKMNFSLETPK